MNTGDYEFRAKPNKNTRFRVKVKATAADVDGCVLLATVDDEGDGAETYVGINSPGGDCI